jgi:hypothetical protein
MVSVAVHSFHSIDLTLREVQSLRVQAKPLLSFNQYPTKPVERKLFIRQIQVLQRKDILQRVKSKQQPPRHTIHRTSQWKPYVGRKELVPCHDVIPLIIKRGALSIISQFDITFMDPTKAIRGFGLLFLGLTPAPKPEVNSARGSKI